MSKSELEVKAETLRYCAKMLEAVFTPALPPDANPARIAFAVAKTFRELASTITTT